MKAGREKLHIAFVSSALTPGPDAKSESLDFFALLLSGIVSGANQDGHSVKVFVPKKETKRTSNQAHILREVLKDFDDIDALIIAPLVPQEITTVLHEHFSSRLANKSEIVRPIVFIDKEVRFEIANPALQKQHPIYNVFCNNRNGGRLAARSLHNALRDHRTKGMKKKFMVLRGLEGSEDRIAGFKEEIRKNYDLCDVVEPKSDDLNFTRADARNWMLSEIDKLEQDRPDCEFGKLTDEVVWGIFACNDEMALGVRSIVSNRAHRIRQELYRATSALNKFVFYHGQIDRDYRLLLFLQNIRIVGFDGIYPALELLRPLGSENAAIAPDPWFIGTVKAGIEDQAAAALQWLKPFASGARSGNSASPRCIDVYPFP